MNKLDKIEQEAQKAREKMAAIQALLKDIEGKRTEQENLQIVQQIRALKLTREELYSFINGGELPGILTATITGAEDSAPEHETIYTRRGKSRRDREPATGETAGYDNPYGENAETPNFESEDKHNEEN